MSLALEPETDVVRVSFESVEPHLAQGVVNQLMRLFLERNIKNNRASSSAARQFITEQLPQVRQSVLTASDAITRFQEANGLISFDASQANADQAFAQLESSLVEVNSELAGVQQQYNDLKQKLEISSSDQALRSSDVSQSPAVQQAIAALREVTGELQQVQGTLSDNHPLVMDLKSRQRELEAQVSALGVSPAQLQSTTNEAELGTTRQDLTGKLLELELTQKGLMERRQVLMNKRREYDGDIDRLPRIQNQYRELQRQLQAAELTYDTLLKRLQEIKVTENQTTPSVEIIEPAPVPAVPVLPNRTSELFRGAIAALLLSYGAAYFLDLLDRKVKTVSDIRNVYPVPVLGIIPENKDKQVGENVKFLPMQTAPQSALAEAYRMLQANLKFLQSDHTLKVIAISSAIAAEGKSTSAANLALALAEGNRVLLIDADLRRSTQHQIWEVMNRFGLSNALTELELSFESILASTQIIHKQLMLLPAGVTPPNPLTLLESNRMEQFLQCAKQSFDYVIVDLPPISVAADALFVSKMADGLLLVARPEKLDKNSAKHCLDTIQQAQVNLLGTLANGVIIKNEPNNYYYSNYYNNEYYAENSEASLSSPLELSEH